MATKYSNEFLKKQKTVSIIGVLCFFLPWFSWSDTSNLIINSGFDIARGGNIIVLFIPFGFLANIILLTNKPNLLYIRTLLFIIPLIYFGSQLYEGYKAIQPHKGIIEAEMELYEAYSGESFVKTIFSSFTYGFYGTLICVLLVYFIPNRITDVNDPDFGEI